MAANEQSTLSRVLGIIVGVLIVILGISCFLTPIDTFGITGWLITFALVIDGVTKVLMWNDGRKIGVKDTWLLIGGILSIVLGIIMMGSVAARVAVDIFVAYLLGIWLFAGGIVRIVRSFQMRKVQKTLGGALGSNWDVAFIAGVVMTVLGIFCVANPVIMMVAVGWGIGFSFVIEGIGLITAIA